MNLPERLHCPACQSRLAESPPEGYRCTRCGHAVTLRNGIADFINGNVPETADPLRYSADPTWGDTAWGGLLDRIRTVAGDRWPGDVGHVLEYGCGQGRLTSALVASGEVRDLVALDSDHRQLVLCRDRIAALGAETVRPVLFAALSGHQNAIRDATADTVIGSALLSTIGDVRGFLIGVHRVLRPGGRALFIVPNRRYRQGLCQALAEALVQHHARMGDWPDGHFDILGYMAQTRRIMAHRDDTEFLATSREKHLFEAEPLEELARQVGFASAEALPLEPDPAGGETVRRICLMAGLPDDSVAALAPLAATAGQPFFSLLSQKDSSASMLLWLTKAVGPRVAIFNARSPTPPIPFLTPQSALGGVSPRWSLEFLALDTPEGVNLSLGGWCLANTDVLWVRVTLDGVTLNASVWRPRPDVHEVLNRAGLYHPFNALCSGIETEMMFDGIHPVNGRCKLHFDIVLVSGLIVSGPAPDALAMDEQVVIEH